jgi:hypothetical protein
VVPTPVTIVGGSSDEEELDEGENAKIIKKKATEKTLCMVCALSKKPDLVSL